MRWWRGNAAASMVVSAVVTVLVAVPGMHGAQAVVVGDESVRVAVRGTVMHLSAGSASRTVLQVPGVGVVTVAGGGVDSTPAGATVEASVVVPESVLAANGVDPRLVAAGAPAGATDTASPLARATLARAVATGRRLTAANVTVVASPPDTASYTRAAHQVTVAIVRPRGVRGPSASAADVRRQVAQASAFWSEESAGGITLTTRTVSAPYTSAFGCGRAAGDDWTFKMWNEATAVTGFVEGPDNHLVLSFPVGAERQGCLYGLATIGGGVNTGGVALVSDTAWPVLAHEIGHNFGLGHAQSLQCTRSDADLTRLPSGCRIVDYGNPWSVMAGSAKDRAGALTTVQSARIGLLRRADLVEVTSGTRTVALNAVSSRHGLRSVRAVDPVTGERYYVEFRTRTGRDRMLYKNVPTGVRVLKADPTAYEQRGSVVLDMTATGRADDIVRQLVPGATFTSRTGRVRVRTVQVGTTATVTVSVTGARR